MSTDASSTPAAKAAGCPSRPAATAATAPTRPAACSPSTSRFERMVGWQARRNPGPTRQEIDARRSTTWPPCRPGRITRGSANRARRSPDQRGRDGGDDRQGDGDGDALQDPGVGGGRVGGEHDQGRGGGHGAGQQPGPPAPPVRPSGLARPAVCGIPPEPCRQQQLHRDQIDVDGGADHVVSVVVPRDAARGEQQVVTAQQAGRDRGQAGPLNEPRRGARAGASPQGLAQCRSERYGAPAEDQESRDHDPRIPRVGRREPADLHPGGRVPGLAQRAGDRRAGEGGLPGDPGRRARPRDAAPHVTRGGDPAAEEQVGRAVGQLAEADRGPGVVVA